MSQILVGADDGNTTTNTWSVDDGHHTHMTRFQGWSVCIHINNEVQILVNKFVKEKSLLQWKQFSSERESFKIPFEQSFWVLHTATLWNDVVVVDVVYNNFILSRPILLSRERNRKTLSRKIPVSTDFSSSLSLSLSFSKTLPLLFISLMNRSAPTQARAQVHIDGNKVIQISISLCSSLP